MYQDEHHFRLGQRRVTVIIALFSLLYGVFLHHGVKNLQKSSAIQNNSVTLSSMIIAIIVCKT
jgi:hypothetical protein